MRCQSAPEPLELCLIIMQTDKWLCIMLQVAEEALVRDVLYACQGVNGQVVQYDQDAQQGLGGYVLNAKAGISAAHRPVMLAICELGWLFRCVVSRG